MSAFLIVSQDFQPDVGGTQTYAWELAIRFARDFRVVVVAPDRPGAAQADALSPFEVRRVPLGLNGFAMGAVPELTRLLASGEVAGILCIQWTACLAVRVASALARTRVPVGLAAHGRELLFSPLEAGGWLSHAYDSLRTAAIEGADAIYPVSSYTAALAEHVGVHPRHIHVVPNGVDVNRFKPEFRPAARRAWGLSEDDRMVLSVCRLVPRKGVDVLLEAVALVREHHHPELRLWVAGDGPERIALKDQALRLGLQDAVRFLGRVETEDLPNLFAAADVFAMVPRHTPPDVEGFGLVYLEASACAVATLGSRAGGISDAVLDGETGLLVEPGDVAATAAALSRLLEEPGLAARLGKTGRHHAENTATWDRVAARIRETLLG